MANKELTLGIEEQKAIIHALLIGLDSYGEIERINDEVGKCDLISSDNPISESVRPAHPTGANNTICVFAEALRYMQQV